ncbi:4-hydroxy-tetrahydrodipicolinate synthase [Treponema brennaborense]|uniref:4-hydroxy-tetrahydrodipicolinate synthase n=1 Tax=Treponema brennaborense (strain DSM 12168 / CIP 105900 / DD5/3) TaxID=906968 RepID=F4LQ68_TREBD|nr:4-hydroxy-tetrahydrodipicolinate synthase [Treponema brennaborense]AEE16089.1 Dihydrodipicolinate synthase [Treponema brennaborense DSM 12168]
MSKLRGAFTALVTPMFADGSLDYDGFRNLVRYQLDNGITGLLPLGTTGETPTLEAVGEEEKIIDIAVEEVTSYKQKQKRDIPLIVGAGSNNTAEAIRYVQRAKDKGADYALVVTPYYNKPSDEGVFRHFEAVSKIGIPIIVYNIMGRTGKNISTPLLMRIADLPNIAGVKEASGDINQMMEVIAKISRKKSDFCVLSGDDGLTLPLIAAGGDGIISVVSNVAPALISKLTAAALAGDLDTARDIHYRLLPFFKAAFCDGNPTSVKYAMNVKGLPAGGVRLPLVEVSDGAKKTIEAALAECGL